MYFIHEESREKLFQKLLGYIHCYMFYKFGPGDHVQKSQLGDVCMMGDMVLEGVCYGYSYTNLR